MKTKYHYSKSLTKKDHIIQKSLKLKIHDISH